MVAKTQYSPGATEPLNWDDVRVFLAVQREKSLGRAGVRLSLDTSTVSRRLSALEEQLGERLFERTQKGLTETALARRLVTAAELMEAAHARLLRDAASLETVAEGVVRISVAPGMADGFIAPLLLELRKRHPRIRIELEASVRTLDLGRYETDLALRSVAPQGADLVVSKLMSAGWVAATGKELARELGVVARWSDVPWINWDADLDNFAPTQWIKRHASGAEIVLRTSHFVAQLVAARTGLGLVLAPEPYLAKYDLTKVRFAPELAESASKWPNDDLWLVGHRATRDLPRVKAVWDFLAEQFRGLKSEPEGKKKRRR